MPYFVYIVLQVLAGLALLYMFGEFILYYIEDVKKYDETTEKERRN